MDAASKPRDPVYSAVVRDPSGYCRLIYRATNACKPSAVKKGKFYRVSGERVWGQAWERVWQQVWERVLERREQVWERVWERVWEQAWERVWRRGE